MKNGSSSEMGRHTDFITKSDVSQQELKWSNFNYICRKDETLIDYQFFYSKEKVWATSGRPQSPREAKEAEIAVRSRTSCGSMRVICGECLLLPKSSDKFKRGTRANTREVVKRFERSKPNSTKLSCFIDTQKPRRSRSNCNEISACDVAVGSKYFLLFLSGNNIRPLDSMFTSYSDCLLSASQDNRISPRWAKTSFFGYCCQSRWQIVEMHFGMPYIYRRYFPVIAIPNYPK